MSAPRIWRLTQYPRTMAWDREIGVRGSALPVGASVETFEAEPVLDLLESLVPTEEHDPSPADLAVVGAFLREHGRLQ